MKESDLASVAVLANAVHAEFPESPEVFAEKRALYPDGCLVLVSGEEYLGYLFSHPWLRGSPPPLDDFLQAIPAGADAYYLHDLALDPRARGKDMAGTVLRRIESLALANGFSRCALVSVGDAAGFWKRQGYVPCMDDALRRKLESYGDTAIYMEKPLG